MGISRLAIPLILVTVVACKKDKFATKPSLTLKEVSTRNVIPAPIVSQTPPLVLTFEYTDAEGDVAGGNINVMKVVPNCPQSEFVDTGINGRYKIPNVPTTKNQIAELELKFPYFFISPRCAFNDTARFKVWITDRACNSSDTVDTDIIVIQ